MSDAVSTALPPITSTPTPLAGVLAAITAADDALENLCLHGGSQDDADATDIARDVALLAYGRAEYARGLVAGGVAFTEVVSVSGVLPDAIKVLGRLSLGDRTVTDAEREDLAWLASRLRWGIERVAAREALALEAAS